MQSIPLIAQTASTVTVFQRTAAYAVPAHNHELSRAEVGAIKDDYVNWRAVARQSTTGFGGHIERNPVGALDVNEQHREAEYDRRWASGGLAFMGAFNDLLLNAESNNTAAEFVRAKIRDVVKDHAVAETLSPEGIIGCKRMCVDTNYYATFNRPNVELVDVGRTPIDKITATGVQIGDQIFDVDTIVFATGFDAMTGAIDRIDIRGRGGRQLRDEWSAGPQTYLGLQVAGFPNLFTITGPGSPSVLTNMIVAIEQHVEWIRDLMAVMIAAGNATVEATVAAQQQWVAYVNAVAAATLFYGCSSWYLGANVPGKPRVFMPLPGFPDYKAKCDQVAAEQYDGFVLA